MLEGSLYLVKVDRKGLYGCLREERGSEKEEGTVVFLLVEGSAVCSLRESRGRCVFFFCWSRKVYFMSVFWEQQPLFQAFQCS